MGQSFGGFCATHYLSFYSDGLTEVFLTGGLPPLVDDPDLVYEALIRRFLCTESVILNKLTVPPYLYSQSDQTK